MPKNIVICADGTGNTTIKGRGTNVFKLYESVDTNGHRLDRSLIQQVAYIIPSSFGVFFLSMLWDRGDTPGRAKLFKNLNTPIDVTTELKDVPDFTAPVFRFLSATISAIGLLSLLLIFGAPADQRGTVLLFATLTLLVGGSLHFIRGRSNAEKSLPEVIPAGARE